MLNTAMAVFLAILCVGFVGFLSAMTMEIYAVCYKHVAKVAYTSIELCFVGALGFVMFGMASLLS